MNRNRKALLRTVWWVGCGVLLACGAHAAPPSDTHAASPSESHARTKKIAELTTDLGYGGEFNHVDAAIPYLAALAGPGDPTWKPGHPRWNEVCATIGQTLRDDAQMTFAENERSIVQGAERSLDATLSDGNLEASLAFFRSPVGHRFLELQNALVDVSIEATLAKDTSAPSMPPDAGDARRRMLDVWLPIVFIRAFYPPQSADQVVNEVLQRFSTLRGARMDALAKRHAEDMPQYETYLKSPAFVAIIEAQRGADQHTPAPDLSAFFVAEGKKHGQEWRAAYFGT